MTQTEGLVALNMIWLQERDLTNRDQVRFCLIQDALLRAGWLYIDEDQQIQNLTRRRDLVNMP